MICDDEVLNGMETRGNVVVVATAAWTWIGLDWIGLDWTYWYSARKSISDGLCYSLLEGFRRCDLEPFQSVD